jgi:hypothetical protein
MCSKSDADVRAGAHYFCDKNEREGNSSSWPIDIARIDLPASPGKIEQL